MEHHHKDHELFWLYDLITRNHQEVLKQLNNLKVKSRIMALTVKELSDKLDALQVTLDEKQDAIDKAFAALKQQIADLIAAGTPDLQPLADKVDALAADLVSTPTE